MDTLSIWIQRKGNMTNTIGWSYIQHLLKDLYAQGKNVCVVLNDTQYICNCKFLKNVKSLPVNIQVVVMTVDDLKTPRWEICMKGDLDGYFVLYIIWHLYTIFHMHVQSNIQYHRILINGSLKLKWAKINGLYCCHWHYSTYCIHVL